MRRRGFSLLELVVVLFIIGLSASLLAPAFSRVLKATELKATARKISSILRNSRSEAVHRGVVQRILFDLPSKSLKVQSFQAEVVEGDERRDPPPTVKTFLIPGWVEIQELKTSPGQLPSEEPAIEFYPNGSSTGGSFLVVGNGQGAYRIEVHPITGSVRIERLPERT